MEPVNCPDDLLIEGFRVVTIGAPDNLPPGMESAVESVQAQVGDTPLGPIIIITCQLQEGDLDRMQANGGVFYYTVFGTGLSPFSFTIPDPPPMSLNGNGVSD